MCLFPFLPPDSSLLKTQYTSHSWGLQQHHDTHINQNHLHYTQWQYTSIYHYKSASQNFLLLRLNHAIYLTAFNTHRFWGRKNCNPFITTTQQSTNMTQPLEKSTTKKTMLIIWMNTHILKPKIISFHLKPETSVLLSCCIPQDTPVYL